MDKTFGETMTNIEAIDFYGLVEYINKMTKDECPTISVEKLSEFGVGLPIPCEVVKILEDLEIMKREGKHFIWQRRD